MEQNLVNAPLSSAAKPRRKWRPTEVRRAELDVRRRRLERSKRQVEARIAKLDPRDSIAARKRETRANIVLGAVLRAHMALNPAFSDALAEILDHNVRRAADRQLLGMVLGLARLSDQRRPEEFPIPRKQKLEEMAADIVSRRI